jgi:hypothetical protein
MLPVLIGLFLLILPNFLSTKNLIRRLVESTEWEALEQAELITLLSSDELAADEPFIIHSIIRQVRLLLSGGRKFG